jgi:hypothetical protein
MGGPLIEQAARTLRYFKYEPPFWSNPDSLHVNFRFASVEDLRDVLHTLGLVPPPIDDQGVFTDGDYDLAPPFDLIGVGVVGLALYLSTGDKNGIDMRHIDAARHYEALLATCRLPPPSY